MGVVQNMPRAHTTFPVKRSKEVGEVTATERDLEIAVCWRDNVYQVLFGFIEHMKISDAYIQMSL
ncbi:hypothetical protein DV706_20085 (plasmid) [Natronorubrum bangense]|uniref:Uncharacterized protein n=2 Tax=Natronorubrum bangense TaxID=61858 RepID=L9W741_9EURY|nr:hypothetical protein C494_15603 [Natronorubrum bangense JCM 10635]QCC56836.1 hypothetical protein DV706_20085 [Natronorubrum bangense]